ncbi:hypothetical protein GOP47_0029031 [Adiantum capillus-veneris]|nr:hypothetical protein GOP47_0029031 [Adiantum capillus-veneris]
MLKLRRELGRPCLQEFAFFSPFQKREANKSDTWTQIFYLNKSLWLFSHRYDLTTGTIPAETRGFFFSPLEE